MLSQKEYEVLRELQRNERQARVYKKVTVLLMLHQDYSVEEIAICLGISEGTVWNYKKQYEEVGIERYLEDNYKAYTGKLSKEQEGELEEELERNLYHSSKEVVSWIQERWGIVYSLEGCVKLLHRLGFCYKKTKLFPCEADKGRQEAFMKELEAIKESLGEQGVLYFMDACHPQHNTRSSYAWIKTGTEYELPSVSGRRRLNINAALNASAPQEVVVRFDESIDAESTWKVYEQLLELHQDKEVIYVVCDNARYYKNKTLQERVKDTKIKQIFLPAYSPNLNLIERLWKFMRRKVIDSCFYRKFERFKEKVFEFFEHIAQYQQELETLISWNFHVPKSKTSFH